MYKKKENLFETPCCVSHRWNNALQTKMWRSMRKTAECSTNQKTIGRLRTKIERCFPDATAVCYQSLTGKTDLSKKTVFFNRSERKVHVRTCLPSSTINENKHEEAELMELKEAIERRKIERVLEILENLILLGIEFLSKIVCSAC